jgi:hypothetical protein
MAMIVSGNQVLFLNPSKTHLPIQGLMADLRFLFGADAV